MSADVEIIAFADDVVVPSTVTVPVLLEVSLGKAFKLINEWMTFHWFELAAG